MRSQAQKASTAEGDTAEAAAMQHPDPAFYSQIEEQPPAEELCSPMQTRL